MPSLFYSVAISHKPTSLLPIMPIAVYRHKKLSVAIPGIYYNPVINHSPRLLRGISASSSIDDGEIVTVRFTQMKRRNRMLMNYDRTWEFRKGKLTVIEETRRNGRVIMSAKRPAPPLATEIWTQDGDIQSVWDQFEANVSARVAVERYLHANIKNPWDYIIVTYDFNPAQVTEFGPPRMCYQVRGLAETETAALNDTSESSENWLNLFESA